MKTLLSIILLLSININSFSQKTKVNSIETVKVHILSNLPNLYLKCKGETDTHLFYKNGFTYYVVLKESLEVVNQYSLKDILNMPGGYTLKFKDGMFQAFCVNWSKAHIKYCLIDPLTGELKDSKILSLNDKFKKVNGYSFSTSPDKSKQMVKIKGEFHDSKKNATKEEKDFGYFVFDDDFNLLFSDFITLESSYNFLGYLDNLGSLYLWSGSDIIIWDAAKEFEKWTEKVKLESGEALNGSYAQLPPVQLEDGNILFMANYVKNTFGKDVLTSEETDKKTIIVKIDYLTKEILSANLSDGMLFGTKPGISLRKEKSYVYPLKNNRFISLSSAYNNRIKTSCFVYDENGKRMYGNLINSCYVDNRSSKAGNYCGSGLAVNYEEEKLFYITNINTVEGIGEDSKIIQNKKWFKSLKQMGTVLFSENIDSENREGATRLVFTPEDGKKYKKQVDPRLTYFSELTNDIYLVLRKK